jgi:hypothetical protein
MFSLPRAGNADLWGKVSMESQAIFYSVQLRLVTDVSGAPETRGVELLALPEGPGEPHRSHFEHWDALSHCLSAVLSSFHLKAIYRTLHAGLTAPLIDRATGSRQIFSLSQLQELGLAN